MGVKNFLLIISILLIISPCNTHPQGAVMGVWETCGLPGSRDNCVTIFMGNNVELASVQFALLFDRDILFVNRVEKTEKSSVLSDLSWVHTTTGIGISLSDTEAVISPGHIYSYKAFLNIFFDVSIDAERGRNYSIFLYHIIAKDLLGNEIQVSRHGGPGFSISEYDVKLGVHPLSIYAPGRSNLAGIISLYSCGVYVSSIEFDLLYDNCNVWVREIEPTTVSASFSEFKWNYSENGIHVSMSDTGSVIAIPQPATKEIAHFLFDIAPNAPEQNYYWTFSEATVKDSSGNELIIKTPMYGFRVVQETLAIADGKGFPGSGGNIVQVIFESSWVVGGLLLDLAFDTTWLSVREVKRTPRTHHIMIHTWDIIDEGIRILMYSECGIGSGSGSIADIYFDVHENAPIGEYTLAIDSAIVADHSGTRLPTDLFNGKFIVISQGDVNSDGSIDIEDVIIAVDIILGKRQPTPGELSLADCNDDDEVNVLDVVCIVNIILGAGDEEEF